MTLMTDSLGRKRPTTDHGTPRSADPLRPIKAQLKRAGLDVHPMTIKRAIARGEIEAVKTGGSAPLLIRDSTFDGWLRTKTVGAAQAAA